MFFSFVFKTDHRNVNSNVSHVLVGVPAAALRMVLKTRACETKIKGNDILTVSLCLNGASEKFRVPFSKGTLGTGLRASIECTSVSPWRYCVWLWKRASLRRQYKKLPFLLFHSVLIERWSNSRVPFSKGTLVT